VATAPAACVLRIFSEKRHVPRLTSAILPVRLPAGSAAQASDNIVPHSLQNFLPAEFSLPQAPQVNPLEDMVREMLKPMLKQWLDEHLPQMVDEHVKREISRITGRPL